MEVNVISQGKVLVREDSKAIYNHTMPSIVESNAKIKSPYVPPVVSAKLTRSNVTCEWNDRGCGHEPELIPIQMPKLLAKIPSPEKLPFFHVHRAAVSWVSHMLPRKFIAP